MSDDTEKDKPNVRLVRSDGTSYVLPSDDQAKQIYMASKHVAWPDFAEAMGWDADATMRKYHPTKWVQEKKDTLAKQQAEQIGNLLFDYRSRWHKDVLQTLRDYPKAVDGCLEIIKARENELIEFINHDIEEKKNAKKQNREPKLKFRKVKTSEITALALALKTAVETKHKSLLINDWSMKVAEQFTDPKQFDREEFKAKDTGWTIEIMGSEKLKTHELKEFISSYYDKPDVVDVMARNAEEDGNAES